MVNIKCKARGGGVTVLDHYVTQRTLHCGCTGGVGSQCVTIRMVCSASDCGALGSTLS